jgi:glycosyltransferase involved in cell wall biosynthesis
MVPILSDTFGDLATVKEIKFGIDNEFFEVTRTIEQDPRIWLTVSRITKDKIGQLLNWGKDYFGSTDELHVIGPFQEALTLPPWIKHHRPASLQDIRKYWLPKAAALVTLSSHSEGLPQIVIEAMAAGVPVIASPIAAHRSIITHKFNGWIASSPETFYWGLKYLSDPDNNRTIGTYARQYVSKHFGTWEDAARRYRKAHLELLEISHHEQ